MWGRHARKDAFMLHPTYMPKFKGQVLIPLSGRVSIENRCEGINVEFVVVKVLPFRHKSHWNQSV